MIKLALICPTWHRPFRLHKVAENVRAATKSSFQLYWGCEPDDRESIMAAADTGFPIIINKYEPSYNNTIQTIYEQITEPFMFFCNDDFLFSEGWDAAPMSILKKRPELMVLGVEDGLENTYHTLQFVRRKYIEEQSGVIDTPGRVFYPYAHNFADTEFTKTAMKRGVWDKSEGPCITHLRLEKDETYLKNDAQFGNDHAKYLERLPLFT